MFSPQIAYRIIGATPESKTLRQYYRHREILAFLRATGDKEAPWIAVDDDAALYADDASLLETDPECGFDSRCAAELAG